MAVPAPGPVLVRPREAEREIDRGIIEEPLEGALEKPLAVEPVVVEGKPVQSCLARQLDLTLHDVRLSQIVEPKVSREYVAGNARRTAECRERRFAIL